MYDWRNKEAYEALKLKKQQLMSKYPLLYIEKSKSMQQSPMYFGLDVGPGWLKIIDLLSANLEALIQEWLKEHSSNKNVPKAVQVKEKFGGLRFYMDCSTKEMEDLIGFAEDTASKTCEDCGELGELCTSGSWLKTLCPLCVTEYKAVMGRTYTPCKAEDKL